MSSTQKQIVVVSQYMLHDVADAEGKPDISEKHTHLDALDTFNHPRIRRAITLQALADHPQAVHILYQKPSHKDPTQIDLVATYSKTQSQGVLTFFMTAWQKWCDLGDARDPSSFLKHAPAVTASSATTTPTPLVPGVVPLPREAYQRPSQNVMGQVGYYCTDTVTPVFDELLVELQQDAAVLQHSLEILTKEQEMVVYAMPTHPGHHAAQDSYGGYCYLNQAAHAAQSLLAKYDKVAVLDVDYHCGNGTASIFRDSTQVLVVSLHCDPEYDYPFHAGFADENSSDATKGGVHHLPLPVNSNWKDQYQPALESGLKRIFEGFGAQALIVSLGLDTLQHDPVTLRRAGFALTTASGDYWEMGRLIRKYAGDATPTLFLQEGGYKMDELGQAAADVVTGFAAA